MKKKTDLHVCRVGAQGGHQAIDKSFKVAKGTRCSGYSTTVPHCNKNFLLRIIRIHYGSFSTLAFLSPINYLYLSFNQDIFNKK